jgi:cytidine deaminase
MKERLEALKARAFVPESGYRVSTVMRSGEHYFDGVNVENSDHRLSTHAEEACISAMIGTLGANARIDEIWVSAPCCGKCRQQISAFADTGTKVHYPDSETTVGAFLPGIFTLKPRASGLAQEPRDIVRKSPDVQAWLKEIPSVAFVSGKPETAVLKLDNGFFVGGGKIEDDAFLSISAVQAALAIAVSKFGAVKVEEVWTSGETTLSERQCLLPFLVA